MRFDMRLLPEDRALLEAAAQHEQISMTDFVLAAALRRARRVLRSREPRKSSAAARSKGPSRGLS